jgi:amidohydrolase
MSVTRVANTGVVARFKGRDPSAPVVAVRGDIDALPIQEETGLDYASAVPGVMHACGHDVHATWAIGAAMELARRPARGDVLVVLQPAEEVGGGAPAILASGALDGVAAIFGGHVDRRFEVGQVIAEAGPLAASADSFTITLVGRGAHGARPHESADAVVAAAAVITALQTIVARRLDPAAPAVCTVGSIHAGVASNVIPERAILTGTLRAMDPNTRRRLGEEVRRLATQGGRGLRCEGRGRGGAGGHRRSSTRCAKPSGHARRRPRYSATGPWSRSGSPTWGARTSPSTWRRSRGASCASAHAKPGARRSPRIRRASTPPTGRSS